MICIYDSKCTDFNNNGITPLPDVETCSISEELNSSYESELEYPIDERGKWQNLVEDNIYKADGQLFRIYQKKKIGNVVKVCARHIFYDLMDNIIEDARPTNLTGTAALDWVLARTQNPHPFTSTGDVGGIDTKYYVRKNPVEAILGSEGIVETWGGEIERDNFVIRLLNSVGADRGVLIAYGKNIQGIEETLDIDNVCTRLMPIGKDGLLLPEKYIDSQYIDNYAHPKIRTVEFSDCEDEDTLRITATAYMTDNSIDIPQFNYSIDFLELSKTEEYKNLAILETVYMGDTVTIKHSKLGIDLKAKVIKIEKNVLSGRKEKIELGNFKSSIATSITKSIKVVKKQIVNAQTFLQESIDAATIQINSALGGYATKRNGELLIMDTEDVNTAVKIWRWNLNGLGYSSTGYNGAFATAITADGHVNADFIDTGTLTANIIKTGILSSINELFSLNLSSGEIISKAGITITGDSITDLMEMFLSSTVMQIRVKASQKTIAEFTVEGLKAPTAIIETVLQVAKARFQKDGNDLGILLND
ncbi:MAG: phage tail spike protein [Anaerofustis sp.]